MLRVSRRANSTDFLDETVRVLDRLQFLGHHGGIMATVRKRRQQVYDHRLRQLVRATGDPTLAVPFGVPRSTARGWLCRDSRPVVTAEVLDLDHVRLQHEVLQLQQRNRKLRAVLRLLLTLVRVLGGRLDRKRLPEGTAKVSVLQAIESAQPELSLRGALRILRLSPARYHQWRRAERPCGLDDYPTCPHSTPTRLTAEEVLTMKTMVEAPEYRHVPTGRLAILAQRLGRVFAAPTTWYKLTRERGWRRPRTRFYPAKPTKGVRAAEPDEVWHIDTTIIKLVDNTKVYLHAVIDNFSRKILAWCVAERFEISNTVTILREALGGAISAVDSPTVVTDGEVENVNADVEGFIEAGLFRRVVALKEVTFSNSMIEAWWRALKYQWLYLYPLESFQTVKRLVAFYVQAHNTEIPHSAFQGQTPEEIYSGRGTDIPQRLTAAKAQAWAARRQANRGVLCPQCQPPTETKLGLLAAM